MLQRGKILTSKALISFKFSSRHLCTANVNYEEKSVSKVNATIPEKTNVYTKFQGKFTFQTEIKDIVTIRNVDELLRKDDQLLENDTFLLPSEIEWGKKVNLNRRIFYAMDFETLFYIFKHYSSSFNNDSYKSLLKRFAIVGKTANRPWHVLHSQPEFIEICHKVWKITPQLDTRSLLVIFKCLNQLDLNGNSLLIQSQMMALKHSINKIEIRDVIFLYGILPKISRSSLGDALIEALPKALSILLSERNEKVNTYSIVEISKMIEICLDGHTNGVRKLLNGLYYYVLPKFLSDSESTDHSLNLVILLQCLLKISSSYLQSMQMEEVGQCLTDKSFDELLKYGLKDVPKMLVIKLLYSISNVHFSHVDLNKLLRLMSEKALNEKWSLDHQILLVILESKLQYLDERLINSISKLINDLPEDSSQYLQFPAAVVNFASILSASKINKEEKSKILSQVEKYMSVEHVHHSLQKPLLLIILNFISMDFIPQNLIKNVLNEEFLEKYLNQSNFKRRELFNLPIINQILKEKNISHSIPSHLLKEAKSLQRGKKNHFTTKIQEILGGANYAVSNYCTASDMFIDHLFCIDRSGKLQDFSACENNLEIFNDEKIQKYAAIEVSTMNRYEPDEQLNGKTKVQFELLRKEGFSVIPLFVDGYSALEDTVLLEGLKEKLSFVDLKKE